MICLLVMQDFFLGEEEGGPRIKSGVTKGGAG